MKNLQDQKELTLQLHEVTLYQFNLQSEINILELQIKNIEIIKNISELKIDIATIEHNLNNSNNESLATEATEKELEEKKKLLEDSEKEIQINESLLEKEIYLKNEREEHLSNIEESSCLLTQKAEVILESNKKTLAKDKENLLNIQTELRQEQDQLNNEHTRLKELTTLEDKVMDFLEIKANLFENHKKLIEDQYKLKEIQTQLQTKLQNKLIEKENNDRNYKTICEQIDIVRENQRELQYKQYKLIGLKAKLEQKHNILTKSKSESISELINKDAVMKSFQGYLEYTQDQLIEKIKIENIINQLIADQKNENFQFGFQSNIEELKNNHIASQEDQFIEDTLNNLLTEQEGFKKIKDQIVNYMKIKLEKDLDQDYNKLIETNIIKQQDFLEQDRLILNMIDQVEQNQQQLKEKQEILEKDQDNLKKDLSLVLYSLNDEIIELQSEKNKLQENIYVTIKRILDLQTQKHIFKLNSIDKNYFSDFIDEVESLQYQLFLNLQAEQENNIAIEKSEVKLQETNLEIIKNQEKIDLLKKYKISYMQFINELSNENLKDVMNHIKEHKLNEFVILIDLLQDKSVEDQSLHSFMDKYSTKYLADIKGEVNKIKFKLEENSSKIQLITDKLITNRNELKKDKNQLNQDIKQLQKDHKELQEDKKRDKTKQEQDKIEDSIKELENKIKNNKFKLDIIDYQLLNYTELASYYDIKLNDNNNQNMSLAPNPLVNESDKDQGKDQTKIRSLSNKQAMTR